MELKRIKNGIQLNLSNKELDWMKMALQEIFIEFGSYNILEELQDELENYNE